MLLFFFFLQCRTTVLVVDLEEVEGEQADRRSISGPLRLGLARSLKKVINTRTRDERPQGERDEAAAALSKMFEIHPNPSARPLCALPSGYSNRNSSSTILLGEGI